MTIDKLIKQLEKEAVKVEKLSRKFARDEEWEDAQFEEGFMSGIEYAVRELKKLKKNV
ncbi:MAG: hypothetical protein AB7U82_28705 [Blastocatellales bacterium]